MQNVNVRTCSKMRRLCIIIYQSVSNDVLRKECRYLPKRTILVCIPCVEGIVTTWIWRLLNIHTDRKHEGPTITITKDVRVKMIHSLFNFGKAGTAEVISERFSFKN